MKTAHPISLLYAFRKVIPALVMLGFCLFNLGLSAQTVTTGKSYINITRPNGGTFLPGDVLEVRATIAVTGGSNSSTSTRINSVRYNDTINLSQFTYVTGSLQMISNEGRLQVPYTDGADTDSAHINTTNGRIRFNIGNGAGAANVGTQGTGITNAGRLWGALRPSFFGGTVIRVYAYRVVISNVPTIADIDTLLTLSAGNFRYRIGSSTTDQVSGFSQYKIRIAPDYGLCSNAIGTNALVGEFGGTFGSGVAQNRAGGTSFVPLPYTFLNFGANAPNDNYYGLANNTSADGSTNQNIAYPNASRVFNIWDIIGDHTGAADPYIGNPPTNTGYAVIINASYQTNRAFTQTIDNLCEETFYEFSAWFRNICRRCSSDSSGKGSGSAGFVPGPGNDSSGVRPNLSFQIDGEEFYTSGNIAYTGLWEKKGFVYKTRPGQTSMTVTIRNNAPGGGGNDWAIDDIGVSTCLPNMSYSPSLAPNVCTGSILTLYDTVRSYFDNYTYYQWQRSTDGGSSWTSLGSPAGPITPTDIGSSYEYVSSYTIPATHTTPSNNGDRYRLVVATSLNNLSDANCRSTDNINIVTLNVLEDCDPVLSAKLTSFNGRKENTSSMLRWTASGMAERLIYDIERSENGNQFVKIATIQGDPNHVSGEKEYSYTDLNAPTGKVFYRIKMHSLSAELSYSRVLQLGTEIAAFAFGNVINPFNGELQFDISSSKSAKANAELIDVTGNTLMKKNFDLREGINQFYFAGTSKLPAGVYVLRVISRDQVIYRRVVKRN